MTNHGIRYVDYGFTAEHSMLVKYYAGDAQDPVTSSSGLFAKSYSVVFDRAPQLLFCRKVVRSLVVIRGLAYLEPLQRRQLRVDELRHLDKFGTLPQAVAPIAPQQEKRNHDYWEARQELAVRIHVRPRLHQLTPDEKNAAPGSGREEDPLFFRLRESRTTRVHFRSDPDNWASHVQHEFTLGVIQTTLLSLSTRGYVSRPTTNRVRNGLERLSLHTHRRLHHPFAGTLWS